MKLNRKEMAARVSILYYEKNKSQNEIAKELDISRSYVSQLLTYAKEMGLVKITVHIDEYNLRMIKKEIEFKSKFPNLKQIYIMFSENEEFSSDNIGKFASPYISELINHSKVIGINLGNAIDKTIKQLKFEDFIDSNHKKVVQTMGGFSMSHVHASSHPNDLVNGLCQVLKSECYFLNSPAILDNAALRQELLNEKSIKEVVNMWDKIDLALIGIGVMDSRSRLFDLLDDNMVTQMKENNIACDLNANFFDVEGKYVSLFDHHKISIPYEKLKNIKKKVVISYGKYKDKAILSALKGNMIDVLITDSITIDAIEKNLREAF
ncbi:MAG: sugar-binding transcriptional regulator [Eubacteriales bacterium]